MKSTLDKILQANRLVKLTQIKAVRLHDKNDTKALKGLVTTINMIFKVKDQLDKTRPATKELTLEVLLANIDHIKTKLKSELVENILKNNSITEIYNTLGPDFGFNTNDEKWMVKNALLLTKYSILTKKFKAV